MIKIVLIKFSFVLFLKVKKFYEGCVNLVMKSKSFHCDNIQFEYEVKVAELAKVLNRMKWRIPIADLNPVSVQNVILASKTL